MAKVILGMSGGVDSAVAAKLLKDQGHEVLGVFMRNWDSAANNDILGNPNKNASVCSEELDWHDVKQLGKQLNIKVDRIDFIKEYWDDVFVDLIKNYQQGRTPNPDVLCNRYIKFGHFQKYVFAKYKNADYIAMGHYADVEKGVLKKPFDSWKDQTYFLAQVQKEVLKKTLFPLASYKKSQIRKIAQENNLVVASKKDSTGICFIGERDFAIFLQNYIPAQPGNIVDITNNKIVGKHQGAMYYTIGQRKGLHLGGMQEPYYVAGHNLDQKIIYVAPQSNESYLMSDQALIKDMNWFINDQLETKTLVVKFRYKSQAVECRIKWLSKNELMVYYPKGFKAVTPGQQAVFYDGDYCLGGGVIDNVYANGTIKSYI